MVANTCNRCRLVGVIALGQQNCRYLLSGCHIGEGLVRENEAIKSDVFIPLEGDG